MIARENKEVENKTEEQSANTNDATTIPSEESGNGLD